MTDARTERAREAVSHIYWDALMMPTVGAWTKAFTAFAADEVALALEEAEKECIRLAKIESRNREMFAINSETPDSQLCEIHCARARGCYMAAEAIRALKEGKAS